MKTDSLARCIPYAAAVIAAGVLWVWWRGGAEQILTRRMPGSDRIEEGGGQAGAAKWEGRLIKSNGLPAELKGVWPRFRGPNADGISVDPTPLAKSWPPEGPRVLWRIPVGEGYAGPIIWQGRVYLLDYDHPNQSDALRCLSLKDGAEIWRYTYPSKVKRDHGMSRTIPTITNGVVVTLGPRCQVVCVDALSGELRWQLNLVREFGTEIPPWYAGQCPLVDGERLILGTGGEALLVAVDLKDGKVLWRSPNPRGWQMTHSSVVPIQFKGRRQYVYCGSGGVAGVSDDGKILWDTLDWKISIANVPSPVPVTEGRLFFSGGYNAGSLMLQLNDKDGKIEVATAFRLKPAVFGATQQTPILYQSHLYGVRPDGQLVCLDLEGKSLWESGATNRYGNGPFLLAQDMIYVLNDSGGLTLAEASPKGFRSLAQAKVLQGHDAWGPMAMADGYLIVRDLLEMACLDVSAR